MRVDPVTKEEIEVVSSFDYKVDGVGNRTEVLEHSGRVVAYKYDALNRLTEEVISNDPNGNNRSIGYIYDAVGNRLAKIDSVEGETIYSYNSLNQLVSLTKNGVVTTYSYDNNGNLVSEVTGNSSVTYKWINDGENRLVGLTIKDNGGSRNIEYEYNDSGIRVAKVVDGVETRFLIDERHAYPQVLGEYDERGQVKASYVYGYGLIAKDEGDEEFFYHADGLGSSRLLTDIYGRVSDSYSYDGYGNLIAATGTGENAYLFAGEQRDKETGLDYLRARYYDPFLGRFISADAYEGTLADPMSLHDYLYAHANPVVNTDPSGYMTVQQVLGNIAAVSVLAGLGYTTFAAVEDLAGGGSLYDAAARYDQFFAGLTDSLSFGISTHLRGLVYGENATRSHKGLFFNLGRLGGAVASMWIGSYGTTLGEFSSADWVARATLGYDLFGFGMDWVQSAINVQKGQATWWDILPLLPVLTWFNINYKVNIKGLGSNFGNLEISRRLSAELQNLRKLTGVRRYYNMRWKGGTVGVAVTDIPGLEDKVFGGASGRARVKIGPPEGGDIKPPTTIQISQDHAEQDMVNQIVKAIESSNLTEDDLVGRTVFMLLEAMPCDTCQWGLLEKSAASPGVLKQFSTRYPQLRMIVTAEGIEKSLKIQGGKIVEDFE